MNRLILIATIALLFAGCSVSQVSSSKEFEQIPQVIAANEMAALARLRSIVTAEMTLQFEGDGKYATLEELVEKGALANPSQGKLTGYRIEVSVKPGGFEATAVPEKFAVTGKRSFYVDESRVVRGADKGGLPASASDPAL
jgi:hypothetical protein